MRNVSSAFMRALAEDKRDYICTATITLVQNLYSNPQVKKNMRYRISGTYTSVSLDGVAITVTEGYIHAGKHRNNDGQQQQDNNQHEGNHRAFVLLKRSQASLK